MLPVLVERAVGVADDNVVLRLLDRFLEETEAEIGADAHHFIMEESGRVYTLRQAFFVPAFDRRAPGGVVKSDAVRFLVIEGQSNAFFGGHGRSSLDVGATLFSLKRYLGQQARSYRFSPLRIFRGYSSVTC